MYLALATLEVWVSKPCEMELCALLWVLALTVVRSSLVAYLSAVLLELRGKTGSKLALFAAW